MGRFLGFLRGQQFPGCGGMGTSFFVWIIQMDLQEIDGTALFHKPAFAHHLPSYDRHEVLACIFLNNQVFVSDLPFRKWQGQEATPRKRSKPPDRVTRRLFSWGVWCSLYPFFRYLWRLVRLAETSECTQITRINHTIFKPAKILFDKLPRQPDRLMSYLSQTAIW